ncbi:endo-1,4-beta-xylanase C-like [Penaeus japonicus]|uniref:endo-1,4-beta-xylanase C-like n=1 Tax=Penaeus japonicus TaxID=27405 RepID=UPI001C715DC0|nr:endo-1,4-beta-xylanase C-like [Penaeus japonicus]
MAVNSITSAASGLAATSSIITTNTTNNATTATTTVNSNTHGGGGSTTPTNTAAACGGPPQQPQPQQPQPQSQTQTPQHHVGCHSNGSCNASHPQNAGGLPPQQNNGAHSQNTGGGATHPPNPGAGHPQSSGGHTNCGATHTYTDANCGANQGFSEHSGHPAPSPFSAANGVFPRKSPPINNQNPNHMTSHVTTLPSSIGRLTLGLASHYAPSPIPEQEEIQSPVSSGKCEILSQDF